MVFSGADLLPSLASLPADETWNSEARAVEQKAITVPKCIIFHFGVIELQILRHLKCLFLAVE